MPLSETTGTFTNTDNDVWEDVVVLTAPGIYQFRGMTPTRSGSDWLLIGGVPQVGPALAESTDPILSCWNSNVLNDTAHVALLDNIIVKDAPVTIRCLAHPSGGTPSLEYSVLRVFE